MCGVGGHQIWHTAEQQWRQVRKDSLSAIFTTKCEAKELKKPYECM